MVKRPVALTLLIAASIISLLIVWSNLDRTFVGTVNKVTEGQTISGVKVTMMAVTDSDGTNHYLGLKGRNPGLKVGDTIEVTYLVWDYLVRMQVKGKPVDYKTIKHYKILPRQ